MTQTTRGENGREPLLLLVEFTDRLQRDEDLPHHIAWAVPPSSVDQVREALETHGAPGYLQANLDDIDLSFHDSSASLGHDVEIHADTESLQVNSTRSLGQLLGLSVHAADADRAAW
jgi:hypothetical protein